MKKKPATAFDLRLQSVQRNTPVTIWVNGCKVPAFKDELLHAVLLAAGFRKLRQSVSQKGQRGFFCGMGVCYECLVTVDGIPQTRACITPVYEGMRVEIDAE
jgi:aerobic-type carbon monoxide dehydrogenase small subunit (CoxS/CutS family)